MLELLLYFAYILFQRFFSQLITHLAAGPQTVWLIINMGPLGDVSYLWLHRLKYNLRSLRPKHCSHKKISSDYNPHSDYLVCVKCCVIFAALFIYLSYFVVISVLFRFVSLNTKQSNFIVKRKNISSIQRFFVSSGFCRPLYVLLYADLL